MTKKYPLVFAVLVMLMASYALPISAQGAGEVVVDGLTNPRQLSYDAEGNLYIAEAGSGGSFTANTGDAYGASGQVTKVTPDGSVSVIAKGFLSVTVGQSRGLHAAQVHGDSLWVLLGESVDWTLPFSHALVELDLTYGRVQTWIDLLALELETDPDGNPNEQSNATDFVVADDGTIFIANAGCNCLMSWTEADGLQVVTSWPHATDNPVPTNVEIGPNGDLYVGFLSGFPFPKEGTRIERWSGGELVETFPGLTAVTGLLVTDDGTIYASEFGGEFAPGAGWSPGRVVMVSADGITPVLENLNAPFGLAQSPDGTIVVAVGSAAGDGGGQVVVVQ